MLRGPFVSFWLIQTGWLRWVCVCIKRGIFISYVMSKQMRRNSEVCEAYVNFEYYTKLGCSNGSCICVSMEVYGSFRISIDKKAVLCQFCLTFSFLLKPYAHMTWMACLPFRDRTNRIYIFDANELIQFINWFNKIPANHFCTPIILLFSIQMEWNEFQVLIWGWLWFRCIFACHVQTQKLRAAFACVRTCKRAYTRTRTHMQWQHILFTLFFFASVIVESVLETMICNWVENSAKSQKKQIFFGVMAIKW